MNKYQKQFIKEVNQFINDKNITNHTYKAIKRACKLQIKFMFCRPCEDCDNPRCKQSLNKIFYCRMGR